MRQRKPKWKLPGKRPRSLSDLKKHPIVEDVSDERGGPDDPADGIWIYLKDGWCWDEEGLHCVHEWSMKDVLAAFENVEPCRCNDRCSQLEVPGTEDL